MTAKERMKQIMAHIVRSNLPQELSLEQFIEAHIREAEQAATERAKKVAMEHPTSNYMGQKLCNCGEEIATKIGEKVGKYRAINGS